jgi:hypothetical protein
MVAAVPIVRMVVGTVTVAVVPGIVVPGVVPAVIVVVAITVAMIPGIVPEPATVGTIVAVVVGIAVVVRIAITVRVAVVEVVDIARTIVGGKGLAADFLAGHLLKIFLGQRRLSYYVLSLEVYSVLKLLNPVVLCSQTAGYCGEGGKREGENCVESFHGIFLYICPC